LPENLAETLSKRFHLRHQQLGNGIRGSTLARQKHFAFLAPFLCVSLFGLTSWGQNDSSSNAESLSDHSWFFYIGTGVGTARYDERTESRQKAQEALGASSPSVGFFDFPAVYRKLQPGVALGFAMNIGLEHTARSFRIPQSYAVHIYNPALSAMYFPQGEMGLRWFVRADVGPSRFLEIREEQAGTSGPVFRHHDVADGTFTQLALGYGWHASQVARLLFHVNAFRVHAGERQASGLNFNVGFLF
jgi:hypothetical protein